MLVLRAYLVLPEHFQHQERNCFEVIFVKRPKNQSTPRCWDKGSDDRLQVSPRRPPATVNCLSPCLTESVTNANFLRFHFDAPYEGIIGQFHGGTIIGYSASHIPH
jgi:hypothetical protein